jgi:hypothetical protein
MNTARLVRNPAAIVCGLLIATQAAAIPILPAKAKTAKGEFVTAYVECVTNGTSTNGPFATAACAPALVENPSCGFGPKGRGRWSLTVKGTDVQAKATITGLDAGCEGETLDLRIGLRITTDDSPGGDVTAKDRDVFPVTFGSCTVTAGACKLSSSFETTLGAGPDGFKDGKVYGVEILNVDMWHVVGAVSIRTLASGLRIGS